MDFRRITNDVLEVRTQGYVLHFRLYKEIVDIRSESFMIGTPTDHLELYPSGKDSVIVFRLDKANGKITGMEDDFSLTSEVMNEFQDIHG